MSHCVDGGINGADTAFLLFATTVVMLQTPAMGLAQCGLIRRKNSLSMLMQTLTGMVIGSLLFFLFGFSVIFGKSLNGWFANPLQHPLFLGISVDDCLPHLSADSVPGLMFAGFQMMFALMVPVIVTGSWCERLSFEAFLVFVILWPILVYYPLAHWIWNTDGWLATLGVLDFAGGLTIHTSSGVAGFVVSLFLQRRKTVLGHSHHNLPMTILGGSLIWAGWYSFNGGSAYKANGQTATVLVNTHLSACTAAACWCCLSYIHDRHWHLTELLNGAFAGLSAITAGSGFVEPWSAVLIGLGSGALSMQSVRFFKGYLKLDDVLDVTSLQGVPGVFGSLCVGLFASERVGGQAGLVFTGDPTLLGKQLLACVLAIVWSLFWTAIVVLFMKHTVGIDVSADVEELGLDISQIGEQAYDEKLHPLLDLGHEVLTVKLCEAAAHGDVAEVQALIRAGADPDGSDYDGRTPAHLAAAEGRLRVLKYLHGHHHVQLEQADRWGGTAMWDAFNANQTKVIKWLRSIGTHLDSGRPVVANLLYDACFTGNIPELSRLLMAGASPNIADYDMRTPLMVAAAEGNVEIAEMLLVHGADTSVVDRWSQTALQAAQRAGSRRVERLLRHGVRDGGKAAQQRQLEAAAAAAESKAPRLREVGEQTPLLQADRYAETQDDIATKRGNEDGDQDKVIDDQSAAKPDISRPRFTAAVRELCTAAAEGHISEVKRLVAKGSDPSLSDYDGRTPMHVAAAAGHLHVVKYLAKNLRLNTNVLDRWRQTPLQEALSHGHGDIVELLKSCGAVVVNKAVGHMLCSCAASGDLDKLKRLFEGGADLNTGDYDARTALHLAASNGHGHIVRYLLASGVTVDPRDRHGGTPLADAENHGHKHIAQLLRQSKKRQ